MKKDYLDGAILKQKVMKFHGMVEELLLEVQGLVLTGTKYMVNLPPEVIFL